MARWLVEVIFPLTDNWMSKDSLAKNIADVHGAEFFGSGAGFAYRDISWTLSSKKKATSLKSKLKHVGFDTTVSKLEDYG